MTEAKRAAPFSHYVPDGKVLTQFLYDRSPFSCLQGPVGSGSSTALLMKSRLISAEQKPNAEGVRKSRWLVVRTTYPELKQTFIRTTYKPWMKPGVGSEDMIESPPYRHHIRAGSPQSKLADGTFLDVEYVFYAVDPNSPDFSDLDSWELTGAIITEAQSYIGLDAISAIHGRAVQGRYPSMAEVDGGATWAGTLMDLNAPPEGHWIPYMRGDVAMPDHWTDQQRQQFKKPDNWTFFVQPPGLIEKTDHKGKVIGYIENPEAENKKWRKLPYTELIGGQTAGWVKTKVLNQVGMARNGEVVFPMFNINRHTAADIQPVPGFPLVVGMDAARNPFATVWQNVRGSWRCYAELGMRSVSASVFAPALKSLLMTRFPQFLAEVDGKIVGVNFWCDPSAVRKGDGTDDSFYSVMRTHGILANVAPGNNLWNVRKGAVEACLMRVTPSGETGFLIHATNCPTLKNAFEAGYINGEDGHPNKSKSGVYADAADSAQYALLGGGEGMAVLSGGRDNSEPKPPRPAKKPFSLKRMGQ